MNFLRSVLFDEEDGTDEEPLVTSQQAEEKRDAEQADLDDEERHPEAASEVPREASAVTSGRLPNEGEIQEVSEVAVTAPPRESPAGEGGEPAGDEEDGAQEAREDGDDGDAEEQSTVLTGWSFSGLLNTIATKSEEVLREYQAELQEFGEGLRKETEELVETTSHAVQDLHLKESLEAGAQVAATAAQSSLEEVGQSLEDVSSTLWQGTSTLLERVQEAVATVEAEVSAAAAEVTAGVSATSKPPGAAGSSSAKGAGSFAAAMPRGKYSRFDALVSAMQRDSSTYCDEPEDEEDFAAWQAGFSLEARQADIERLLAGNAFMAELQSRIVPLIVEREAFWSRYFYRLHKLQQAEDARSNLVKRATAEEEEDLSWDVDEEGEEGEDGDKAEEPSEDKEDPSAAPAPPEKDGEPGSKEGGAKDKGSGEASADVEQKEAKAEVEGASSGGSSNGSEWQVVAEDAHNKQDAAEEGQKGAEKNAAAGSDAAQATSVAADERGKTKSDAGSKTKGEEEEDWGEWE